MVGYEWMMSTGINGSGVRGEGNGEKREWDACRGSGAGSSDLEDSEKSKRENERRY